VRLYGEGTASERLDRGCTAVRSKRDRMVGQADGSLADVSPSRAPSFEPSVHSVTCAAHLRSRAEVDPENSQGDVMRPQGTNQAQAAAIEIRLEVEWRAPGAREDQRASAYDGATVTSLFRSDIAAGTYTADERHAFGCAGTQVRVGSRQGASSLFHVPRRDQPLQMTAQGVVLFLCSGRLRNTTLSVLVLKGPFVRCLCCDR